MGPRPARFTLTKRPAAAKALSYIQKRGRPNSPSRASYGPLPPTDVMVLSRVNNTSDFETEVSFLIPNRATSAQKLNLTCAILENLKKHGGEHNITVQLQGKDAPLDRQNHLGKKDSYTRLNPIIWSNKNKVFVSLQRINMSCFDKKLFVKAWTDREYVPNSARSKAHFLMLEDFDPKKQLSDDEKAWIMLRKQHRETNDMENAASSMLMLKDRVRAPPEKQPPVMLSVKDRARLPVPPVKQSVFDLQRNLAARNEELAELLKENEKLQRDIQLRERERDEASDIYETAKCEQEEAHNRLRDEYARLKKEEGNINEVRRDVHEKQAQEMEALGEELRRKQEELRSQQKREIEELNKEYTPRMKLVMTRLQKMEQELPELGILAPESDAESEEL